MKVFKLNETASIPVFATDGSAAFDLHANILENTKVRAYNPHNKEMLVPVRRFSNGKYSVQIPPQFRMLVPTGLVFDIPDNHVLKLYIRSSMALKNGLNLANNVAIIDSDYVEETFILLHNIADTPVVICDGDRIAQGILEKLTKYTLTETTTRPEKKTDRDGGMGSTGK